MKNLMVALMILGTTASAPYVHASEYGCKVLLCLANPRSNGGPKEVAECVGPIDRLYDDLRHGRRFPSCDKEDGSDGSSYAREVYDPYDPCPVPLQPVAQGTYVAKGKSGQSPAASEARNEYGGTGPRACVGKEIGSYVAGNSDENFNVHLFDKVEWQKPQNPRAIDIYVDNKWYQRVRW